MERTRWMQERGSALPLLAIVLGGLVLALSLVLVQGQYQARLARAQWAADGAARAAAAEVVSGVGVGGVSGSAARRAATVVAEANGARLVSIEVVDRPAGPDLTSSQIGIRVAAPISPTVAVEVELGGIRARAAAARYAVGDP